MNRVRKRFFTVHVCIFINCRRMNYLLVINDYTNMGCHENIFEHGKKFLLIFESQIARNLLGRIRAWKDSRNAFTILKFQNSNIEELKHISSSHDWRQLHSFYLFISWSYTAPHFVVFLSSSWRFVHQSYFAVTKNTVNRFTAFLVTV